MRLAPQGCWAGIRGLKKRECRYIIVFLFSDLGCAMFNMSIKEVDAFGLEQMREQGEVVLIDVRTDLEFAQGSVPGAKLLPLHMLPLIVDQLENQKPTIFICRSGARSAQACAFLASKGFDNVFNLRGGVIGWAQAGKALAAA